MRGPGRIVIACLVLTLAGAPAGAAVNEKGPATGDPADPAGLPPAAVAVDPAPAPAADVSPRDKETSWGFLARGGYFGLPDVIADKLFRQHPKVDGYTYGGELRYHGDGGGRGVSSIGLAVDYARTEGDGIWQPDAEDRPEAFSGEISMLAFTVTGYWSMFPSWYVHPYVGLGLGAAHLKGDYQKEDDLTTVDAWIPVIHIPVGMAFEFGEHWQVSLEARFLDGFAAGGALQARF